MTCVLRIAGYEAILKHMVDAFWHTAHGAKAFLTLPAPLEPTTRGQSTISQLVGPNEGPFSEKHGTTHGRPSHADRILGEIRAKAFLRS